MIEILSLPRRPKEVVTTFSKSMSNAGLPINSLPGWEQIPLNSKLPMRKCPGNQVIFSKNKIGKSIQSNRHLKNQFDPSGHDQFPEYNALHDSNLRRFYANERNLKRLRANGEITEQNDVICNLKAFNEHRQQLNKYRLHFILQTMQRLEEEQHDRLLITNAENIASREQRKISGGDTYSQVRMRKTLLDQKKLENFKKSWETKMLKLDDIKLMHAHKLAAIEQLQGLRELNMRKHFDVRKDIERKRLILYKKQNRLKNDRTRKNLLRLKEGRSYKDTETLTASWNKRIYERIENQQKMELLLQMVENKRQEHIEHHISAHKEKWHEIEKEIKARSARTRKVYNIDWKTGRPLTKKGVKSKDGCTNGRDYQDSFANLLDEDICKALNAVFELSDNIKVPFDASDPIYKAAQFIINHIVSDFHKDLTCDEVCFASVYNRMDNFFDELKNFVLFRATQIISAARDSIKEVRGPKQVNGNEHSLNKHGPVRFSQILSTIGTSSYEIHPLMELREVSNRKPTPADSLDSIVLNSTTDLAAKTPSTNLRRNELVFVEHFVIKFKRELLVGVGRRVFAAISCHFAGKIMDVRHKLLTIDRKFLVNQVTKGILGYGENSLNFDSILRLCISALSSDIIWSLQQVLLKTPRDPRRIGIPDVRNNCMGWRGLMCMSCDCHEIMY